MKTRDENGRAWCHLAEMVLKKIEMGQIFVKIY